MADFYLCGDITDQIRIGKEKSQLIKQVALSIELRPMNLPKITKIKLSYDEFQDLLDIYENNQMYHRNNVEELKKLEKWFCSIKEPYPPIPTESNLIEWRERERRRLRNSISDYCHKDIRKLLQQ